MIRLLSFAVLAATAMLASAPAEAAKSKLPPGSYIDSCRNLYVEGNTIYGECINKAKKWKKTWISGYMYCDGDIANKDGVLDCVGGRKTVEEASGAAPAAAARAPKGDLPPGPWATSCRDPIIDGSVLRATCRDDGGTWRPTWLDLRQCPDGDIANEDGLLVCLPPPPPPKPQVVPMRDTLPKGDWIESCRSAAVQNFQMRGECFDGVERWLVTDLNLKSCRRNRVAVDEGHLVCD